MRITFVTETFPPEINGVAKTLATWTTGLAGRGHEVEVVRPKQASHHAGPAAGGQRVDGIPQTVVPGAPLPGYRGLRFGLPCPRRLRQLWQQTRPDLVHVATEGPLGWSAVSVARRLGIPVSSSFHTNFHQYGRYYGFGLLFPFAQRYLSRFHRRTQRTFVPTPTVRDRLAARGLSGLSIVGRGVDGSRFSPVHRDHQLRREWGEGDPSRLFVLYVGRLAREKNLDLAIQAFRAVQREQPRARFVLVGDGPAGRTLRRNHPDLVFCGSRTGHDLARHYASADLFLFPSRTDTFGNVVLEAMSSALPVVAFDDAAASMYVEPWVQGLTVPLGNPSGFVEGVATLARKPEALRSMGQAARERVRSATDEAIIDQLEQDLLRLAAEPAQETMHPSVVS